MGRRPTERARSRTNFVAPFIKRLLPSLPPLPLPSFLRRKRCQLLPRPTMRRKPGGGDSFRPRIRKRFCELRVGNMRCYRAHPAFSCLAAMLPSFIKTRRKEEVTERERRGKLHAGCARRARLMKRKPLKYNAKKEGARRKPEEGRKEKTEFPW